MLSIPKVAVWVRSCISCDRFLKCTAERPNLSWLRLILDRATRFSLFWMLNDGLTGCPSNTSRVFRDKVAGPVPSSCNADRGSDKKLMQGQPSSRLGWVVVAATTVAMFVAA